MAEHEPIRLFIILVTDQLPRGELLRRVEAFLWQHQANQVKNQIWFL